MPPGLRRPHVKFPIFHRLQILIFPLQVYHTDGVHVRYPMARLWYHRSMRERHEEARFDTDRRHGFVAVALLLAVALSVMLLLTPHTAFALSMRDGFSPDLSVPAAYASERWHQTVLYASNTDVVIEIPGVARLLTLYIAVDRLTLDEMIPITRAAAQLAQEERATNSILLNEGDQVPLRYLLLRMLFENSDAAALAIAGKISLSADAFVVEMQRTAALLGMNDTTVFSCDIARKERVSSMPTSVALAIQLQEKQHEASYDTPLILPEAEKRVHTAKTTLRDIARLMTALSNNARGVSILGTREDLLHITVDGIPQIVSLRSPVLRLWTLSEETVSIAFSHTSTRYSLLTTVSKTEEGIPVTTVFAGLRQANMITPTLLMLDEIDGFYTISPLTRVGDRYPGAPEKAENGDLFNLVYLDSIDYVHPKTDHFMKPTLTYEGSTPHKLPILRNDMVGNVIFTKKDDTHISVRVGSDRDIIADNSFLGRGILQMVNNPNLAKTIIALLAIVGIALLVFIIREARKLYYWWRLLRVENAVQSARTLLMREKPEDDAREFFRRKSHDD